MGFGLMLPLVRQRLSMAWPLPALLVWAMAWATAIVVQRWVAWPTSYALATLIGLVGMGAIDGAWRRAVVGGGFPASALALAAAGTMPAWVWLLPLALLAAVYPLRAWRDAPIFPTPIGALDALATSIPLAPGARVLDAGCGAGDGLLALQRAWPQARLEGVEWSWPLALLASLRCRAARVVRRDMWAMSWQGLALVYMFQRPESMARAWAKGLAEMAPGTWFVSLEFDLPGRTADLELTLAADRRLRAWRIPPQPCAGRADNSPVTRASVRND